MGVPSFYRWLVQKYPKVAVKAIEDKRECSDKAKPNPNGIEFDNLYLDMNGIIHPCFHPEDDDDNNSSPTTFEDVFNSVFEYIDRLVNVARPRKLLYMAIDGVAPRAKMNQQRSRRFRNAKDLELREAEEERVRRKYEMDGKQVLPEEKNEVWDSNVITPGTEFMHKLSNALKSYICSRLKHDEFCSNIKVIFSDANVPGEGEHKIMTFIRKQRSLLDYDPNTRHCLYGLDADLIMLAMATHEPHFSILREDVLSQEQTVPVRSRGWLKDVNAINKSRNPSKPFEVQTVPAKSRGWFKDVNAVNKSPNLTKSFEFLHVWLLREYLELDMKIQDPPKGVSIDFERIVDDFIFMCFFAGNDFLPHMPSLEIHEGAIDLLMTVYKKEFKNLGGHLIDMNRVEEKKNAFVKLSRVERFMLMIGTYEEKIFRKRSEIKEKKMRRLLRDLAEAQEEEDNAASFPESDEGTNLYKKAPSLINSCVLMVNHVASSSEILQNTKEMKEEVKRNIRKQSDLFKNGDIGTDKIRLGSTGFKYRYYKEKFSVASPSEAEARRKDIVQKYTEGLLWVIQYYFKGVPSWTWFYPYHYGPFASDMKGMSQVTLNFQKGVPFKPFDQLLGVLPPRSARALPEAFTNLMVNEESSLIDFYPHDFDIDTEGKRYMWQGICKLPFIDDERLLSEARKLEKELSGEDEIRNSVSVDLLFVGGNNKLASKIWSPSDEQIDGVTLDTITSDGIGGFIRRLDTEEKVHDNLKEDCVLCFCYELPVGGIHTSRLLPRVKLPERTISEGDVMDTQLWHEVDGRNLFQRTQVTDECKNANSWRHTSKFSHNGSSGRFSSSWGPPEVIHKEAGAGWSRGGRGRSTNNLKQSTNYVEPCERGAQFWGSRNRSYQSVQSDSIRFGWGRGRGGQGSNSANPWRNHVSN